MRTIIYKYIFFVLVTASTMFGQSENQADSLNNFSLTEIVVTADKFSNKLFSSAASIEKLNKININSVPVNELTELFNYVPGYYTTNLDGLGKTPIVSTRGFYGGGEAEYVSVFIDGKQINDLQSGLVNWNLITPKNMDNVEMVKGGASPLYGDVSMGGVISISSNSSTEQYGLVNLSAGNFGSYGLSLNYNNPQAKTPYNFYGAFDNTDGFRDHSQWKNYSFGGNVELQTAKSSSIIISTNNQILESETPGALDVNTLEADRTSSLPYYKFDGNDEQRYNFGVEYKNDLSEKSNIDFLLSYNHSKFNNVRTFINSTPIIDPETFQPIGIADTSLYGDTKRSNFDINNINSAFRYYSEIPVINLRIVAGAELDYGFYSNQYYDLFNGFYVDYENGSISDEELSSDGKGNRLNGAAFVNTEFTIVDGLDLYLGLRYDYIKDDYESSLPDTTFDISNSAVSPKIGLNYQYSVTQDYLASVYVNVNRSFKAPTVNQLIDFNALNFGVFVPAGPDNIFVPIKADPFGNALLKPQKSLNFEIGTYQMLQLSSSLSSELSLVYYHMDVEDEIDFDLNTFKYGNIGESLHQGVEAGLKFNYTQNWGLFINYTYTRAEFKSGEYKDNLLKGIPEHFFSGGLQYASPIGLGAAITMRALSDIYIDDENENYIPAYQLYDAMIGYKYKFFEIRLNIINLLDTDFNSTGFMLGNEQYLYPGAGRVVKADLFYNL